MNYSGHSLNTATATRMTHHKSHYIPIRAMNLISRKNENSELTRRSSVLIGWWSFSWLPYDFTSSICSDRRRVAGCDVRSPTAILASPLSILLAGLYAIDEGQTPWEVRSEEHTSELQSRWPIAWSKASFPPAFMTVTAGLSPDHATAPMKITPGFRRDRKSVV